MPPRRSPSPEEALPFGFDTAPPNNRTTKNQVGQSGEDYKDDEDVDDPYFPEADDGEDDDGAVAKKQLTKATKKVVNVIGLVFSSDEGDSSSDEEKSSDEEEGSSNRGQPRAAVVQRAFENGTPPNGKRLSDRFAPPPYAPSNGAPSNQTVARGREMNDTFSLDEEDERPSDEEDEWRHGDLRRTTKKPHNPHSAMSTTPLYSDCGSDGDNVWGNWSKNNNTDFSTTVNDNAGALEEPSFASDKSAGAPEELLESGSVPPALNAGALEEPLELGPVLCELPPAFLNEYQYPKNWLVYHPELRVVPRQEAQKYDLEQANKRRQQPPPPVVLPVQDATVAEPGQHDGMCGRGKSRGRRSSSGAPDLQEEEMEDASQESEEGEENVAPTAPTARRRSCSGEQPSENEPEQMDNASGESEEESAAPTRPTVWRRLEEELLDDYSDAENPVAADTLEEDDSKEEEEEIMAPTQPTARSRSEERAWRKLLQESPVAADNPQDDSNDEEQESVAPTQSTARHQNNVAEEENAAYEECGPLNDSEESITPTQPTARSSTGADAVQQPDSKDTIFEQEDDLYSWNSGSCEEEESPLVLVATQPRTRHRSLGTAAAEQQTSHSHRDSNQRLLALAVNPHHRRRRVERIFESSSDDDSNREATWLVKNSRMVQQQRRGTDNLSDGTKNHREPTNHSLPLDVKGSNVLRNDLGSDNVWGDWSKNNNLDVSTTNTVEEKEKCDDGDDRKTRPDPPVLKKKEDYSGPESMGRKPPQPQPQQQQKQQQQQQQEPLPDLLGSADIMPEGFTENDYQELRQRYLEPRDSDPDLPGGMRLRAKRGSKPPLIDSKGQGWRELKRCIQRLEREQNNAEIYRLLHQLRNWEIYRFRFPTVTERLGTGKKNGDDNDDDHEVQEIYDLLDDDDIDKDIIDVDTYIVKDLLVKVVKADPDQSSLSSLPVHVAAKKMSSDDVSKQPSPKTVKLEDENSAAKGQW